MYKTPCAEGIAT